MIVSNTFNNINEIKEELRRLTEEEKVKIAFFGQPGAGKSSLINEIVGEEVSQVSSYTDTTVDAEPYEWNNLVLMDLPGYGTEMFPKETYWNQFNIDEYDLFLCVLSGKWHDSDTEFFNKLKNKGKVCIFVRNQSDNLFDKRKSIDQIKAEIKVDISLQIHIKTDDFELIFTSCKTGEGIDELIKKIDDCLDSSKRECWERNAKAHSIEFLTKKKEACSRLITLAAGASALNGLNPVIGTDIAIDMGILVNLSKQLQKNYGISDEKLKEMSLLKEYDHIFQIINRVLKYASTDGINAVLKAIIKKEIPKKIVKIIPFVGQAISATAGFALTYYIGKQMRDDFHTLAESILKNELDVNA